MSELVPQCDNFDAEICWRYASTAESKCLRCGHIEVCHVALDAYAGGDRKLCWFKRYPPQKVEEAAAPDLVVHAERYPAGTVLPDDLITSLADAIFNAKPDIVTGTVPFESPKLTLANLDIARMRIELYESIRRFEKDDSLEGFHLARVWVRLGEWARLTGDVCRYKDENPPKMGPAQVGSMWIDTLSANIPICENPFIAEKIIVRPDPAKSTAMQMAEAENSPRRVICVLEYEREREGAYRWWIQLPARETLLRILTE